MEHGQAGCAAGTHLLQRLVNLVLQVGGCTGQDEVRTRKAACASCRLCMLSAGRRQRESKTKPAPSTLQTASRTLVTVATCKHGPVCGRLWLELLRLQQRRRPIQAAAILAAYWFCFRFCCCHAVACHCRSATTSRRCRWWCCCCRPSLRQRRVCHCCRCRLQHFLHRGRA